MRFSFTLGGKDEAETVVLVHGLLHRSIMLWLLARFFRRNGFRVKVYDYATTRDGALAHGIVLRKYLEEQSALLAPGKKMHVVVHSMGGLLLRSALDGDDAVAEKLRIGRCVMLGTPNHGSPVADFFLKNYPWLSSCIKSMESLGTAYSEIPPMPPQTVFGVVAAQHDELVPGESAKLDGMTDFTFVDSTHDGLICRRKPMEKALEFLKNGRFNVTDGK